MIILGENANITLNMDGTPKLTVDILPESKLDLLSEADYIINSKVLALDINRSFHRRSLDANKLFWLLCARLADALEVSNEEMYKKLLWDYGAFDIVSIYEFQNAEEIVNHDKYRIIEYIGHVKHDDLEIEQYRCFKGTSEYNTKEMSRLIKGAIYECNELELPIEAKSVVEDALENWRKE